MARFETEALSDVIVRRQDEREQKRKEYLERSRYWRTAAELRALSYSDYLNTEEWHFRRRSELKRDAWMCRVCAKPSAVDVYHRTHERIGEEGVGDLITLCHDCHKLFHDNGKLKS